VASESKRLRLYFLPPYSPELNPDEYVWNDLKNNGIGRKIIHDPNQMRRDVLAHMRSLQRSPNLIKSFFQSPSTAYAA
ncbi:MAG: transposase, partial [Acidobacteriota bacterium]|nr:transposase [Acidobacteriota bacterium]